MRTDFRNRIVCTLVQIAGKGGDGRKYGESENVTGGVLPFWNQIEIVFGYNRTFEDAIEDGKGYSGYQGRTKPELYRCQNSHLQYEKYSSKRKTTLCHWQKHRCRWRRVLRFSRDWDKK